MSFYLIVFIFFLAVSTHVIYYIIPPMEIDTNHRENVEASQLQSELNTNLLPAPCRPGHLLCDPTDLRFCDLQG